MPGRPQGIGKELDGKDPMLSLIATGVVAGNLLIWAFVHVTVSLCVQVPSVVLAVLFGLQEVPAVASRVAASRMLMRLFVNLGPLPPAASLCFQGSCFPAVCCFLTLFQAVLQCALPGVLLDLPMGICLTLALCKAAVWYSGIHFLMGSAHWSWFSVIEVLTPAKWLSFIAWLLTAWFWCFFVFWATQEVSLKNVSMTFCYARRVWAPSPHWPRKSLLLLWSKLSSLLGI